MRVTRATRATVPRVELRPGYSVARVINGCWQLSDGHREGGVSADRAVDDWIRLAEAGFTTFDCADIYTGVEELLGRFVKRWRSLGRDPEAIQIHTKYVPDLADLATLSKADVKTIVDRSLDRLGVERLDLVQFAWWDYGIPGWVETMGWLEELRASGKIRFLGATNFDAPRLREMLDAGFDVVAHQVQYSLLDRRPVSTMAELCSDRGVSLLTYGSLAGGFLSSRWIDAAEPRKPLENRSLVKYRLIIEEFGGWTLFSELLDELARVSERHGVSVSAAAAAWVLQREAVGAIIAGARNAAHLDENLRLATLDLTECDLEGLETILTRSKGPRGEPFGLERDLDGPHSAIMWKNLNHSSKAQSLS